MINNDIKTDFVFPKSYIAIFVLLTAACALYLFHDGVSWSDFPTQWRVCEYTLRGINVYAHRSTDIGTGFHASPWGCFLQNIFYGGFLSFDTAKVYFIAANIFILIVVSLLLSRKFGTWAFFVSMLSADFIYSIHEGNAGAMICALLVTALLIYDKHPYVAGFFVGVAMVKPQDALIICFFFILTKHIKPLIVGAVIDISAWFATSILTKTNMAALMKDFLTLSDKPNDWPFAGIFTFIFSNFYHAMLASMLFGIIFVLLIIKYLPEDIPEIFKAYPAFMAVTFWCYSYSNDYYVLIIPSCLCIYLMMAAGRVSWFFGSLYCSYGLIVRNTLRRALFLNNAAYAIKYHVPKSIYELGIIAMGLIICLGLRRIYSEAKS